MGQERQGMNLVNKIMKNKPNRYVLFKAKESRSIKKLATLGQRY